MSCLIQVALSLVPMSLVFGVQGLKIIKVQGQECDFVNEVLFIAICKVKKTWLILDDLKVPCQK